MANEDAKRVAFIDFVLKVSSLERIVEVRRQLLCDRKDFQPYVAFMRMNRDSGLPLSAEIIQRFLADNMLEVSLAMCESFISHYDYDKDGLLNYKEFIEVVLPREHPDLRGYVSQQDCFSIDKDEYLSYETECSLARLIEREVFLYEDAMEEKRVLIVENNLNSARILELVDPLRSGNVNFNNLQQFFNQSGLLPYDAELINFLRRLDKDDDGVINHIELENFLTLFKHSIETPSRNPPRDRGGEDQSKITMQRRVSEEKLRKVSPNRKIVDASNKNLKVSKRSPSPVIVQYDSITSYKDIKPKPATKVKPNVVKASEKNSSNTSRSHIKNEMPVFTKQFTPLNQARDRRKDGRTPGHERKISTQALDYSSSISENYRRLQEGNLLEKRLKSPSLSYKEDRHPNSHMPITRGMDHSDRPYPTSGRPSPQRTPPRAPAQHLDRSQGRYEQDNDSEVYAPFSQKPIADAHHQHLTHSNNPSRLPRPVTDRSNPPDDSRNNYSRPSSIKANLTERDHYLDYDEQTHSYNHTRANEARERGAPHLPSFKQQQPPSLPNQPIPMGISQATFGPAKEQQVPIIDIQGAASKVDKGPIYFGYQIDKQKEDQDQKPTSLAASNQTTDRQNLSLNSAAREAKTSEVIYRALKFILVQQKNLELARRELVSKTDFSVIEVFHRIDKKKRGWFTIEDFKIFLSEIGLKNVDVRSLIDLYSSYDVSQSCLLNFDQLINMLSPFDSKFASLMNRNEKKVLFVLQGNFRNNS